MAHFIRPCATTAVAWRVPSAAASVATRRLPPRTMGAASTVAVQAQLHALVSASVARSMASSAGRAPPAGSAGPGHRLPPRPTAAAASLDPDLHKAASLFAATKASLAPKPAAAAAAADAPGASSSTPPPPSGMFARVKHLIKEYGATALVLYEVAWVVPAATVYTVASLNGNFGLDPLTFLDFIGMREAFFSYFALPPGHALEPWVTSAIIAFVSSDVLEPLRLGAVLWAAPRVKRWWEARRAGGGGARAAAPLAAAAAAAPVATFAQPPPRGPAAPAPSAHQRLQ
jgi:hypothetical protein